MSETLKIELWPSPVLLKPTEAVKEINGSLKKLIDAMAMTMYSAPGVGLAANQVGKKLRVAVIDTSPIESPKNLIVLINPEIVQKEGKEVMEEGCLSLPGFRADIVRAAKVVVRAVGLDEKQFEIEADGLLARALQHEIDHLDGKVFPDRLSRLKREFFLKKVRKAIENGVFGKMEAQE